MSRRTLALYLFMLLAGFLAIATVESGIAQPPNRAGYKNDQDLQAYSLELEPFASGLARPAGVANAGDLRLFVLEQSGIIRVVEPDGSVRAKPFLDIRDRVDSSQNEEGLLGLAFHPRYHVNGYFFVNYTHTSADQRSTRISRFRVTGDANIADANSENVLLTVQQPMANHNAGRIAFGPDGYLYVPLGDGGGGGDQLNNAQNPGLLLGKVSRIDVDGGPGLAPDCLGSGTGAYAIPADNPFLDGAGGTCDEIWASGLRNPWQSSFDSLTGDFFIADVGQSSVEEVNLQSNDSPGSENYGWRCFEGSQVFNSDGCGPRGDYDFPIFEYVRPTAFGDCSVTGGFVYRGTRFPAFYGRYFLTDYCSGRFWDLKRLPVEGWQATSHAQESLLRAGNSAFGQRCDGELFVVNVLRGELYHLVDGLASGTGSQGNLLPEAFTPSHWLYLPFMTWPACR